MIHHDGKLLRFPIGEPDGSASPRLQHLRDAMTLTAAMRELAGVPTPTIDEIYALLRLRTSSAAAAR